MKRVQPLLIGITGGIGSGKSTVARVFFTLGIPVYDSDARARWLTNHDAGIKERVVALLGSEAYDAEGHYNRSYVAGKVFENQALLRGLNDIIHPRVREDTLEWVQEHRDKPYLLKEAAIMSGASDDNGLDYVIAVMAPEELRIARVLKRDRQRTRAEVVSIIRNQVSDTHRMAIADFVVWNDDDHPVIPQVLALHEKFSQSSAD